MIKRYTAEETLNYLTELLLYYLEELSEIRDTDKEQFMYGEKTAFTECLEMVQLWEKAGENGLNFEVEAKYPL